MYYVIEVIPLEKAVGSTPTTYLVTNEPGRCRGDGTVRLEGPLDATETTERVARGGFHSLASARSQIWELGGVYGVRREAASPADRDGDGLERWVRGRGGTRKG